MSDDMAAAEMSDDRNEHELSEEYLRSLLTRAAEAEAEAEADREQLPEDAMLSEILAQFVLAQYGQEYECHFLSTAPTMRSRQRKPRKPRVAPPDGLRTEREAAAKLGCSVKTLKGHVASGALAYVSIGRGSKRQRRMFTDADLDAFIANQTHKDVPACPSTGTRARRTGNSISGGEVIAFSAAPRPGPGAKPRR
jgi:Helix-turn-helix domain